MIRVFLVDDNRIFLDTLARFLQGFSDLRIVGQATSGEEALRTAPKVQPQIMLIDQNMVGLSGIETVLRLRAALPDLRVIMLTFQATERLRLLAEQVGIDGLLPKSKISDELIPTIRQCLTPHG